MDIEAEELKKIKKSVVIAMFSDDELMEKLVLKGGSAIDLIYNIPYRVSKDVDFSIENEFKQEEIDLIKGKIEKVLTETFREIEYEVFDITFKQKPQKIKDTIVNFWGGYEINFKIIEISKHKELLHDPDSLRRHATVLGRMNKRKFKIDISKFEYCIQKRPKDLDGYTIYVYTPEMIVFEKVRSICQQMPEYITAVKSSQSGRARDFFDIYTLIEHFKIDLTTEENIELLKDIFKAKEVPLSLIGKIKEYREYHRSDFPSLQDTVKPDINLESFDFYFDYVVKQSQLLLKILGEV